MSDKSDKVLESLLSGVTIDREELVRLRMENELLKEQNHALIKENHDLMKENNKVKEALMKAEFEIKKRDGSMEVVQSTPANSSCRPTSPLPMAAARPKFMVHRAQSMRQRTLATNQLEAVTVAVGAQEKNPVRKGYCFVCAKEVKYLHQHFKKAHKDVTNHSFARYYPAEGGFEEFLQTVRDKCQGYFIHFNSKS